MTALTVESKREIELAGRLREIAVEEIESRGTEAAAEALNMAPTGVRALLWRSTWSIETAFRVIEALDLEVVRSWENAISKARYRGSTNGHES